MSFYEKYLKYKTKYLMLKSQIGGEDCDTMDPNSELYKGLSKIGYNPDSLAYRCQIVPPGKGTEHKNKLLKEHRSDIIREFENKMSSKQKIGSEYIIYFTLLEDAYNESKDRNLLKKASDLYDYLLTYHTDRSNISSDDIKNKAPQLIKANPMILSRKVGSMILPKEKGKLK